MGGERLRSGALLAQLVQRAILRREVRPQSNESSWLTQPAAAVDCCGLYLADKLWRKRAPRRHGVVLPARPDRGLLRAELMKQRQERVQRGWMQWSRHSEVVLGRLVSSVTYRRVAASQGATDVYTPLAKRLKQIDPTPSPTGRLQHCTV
jgi:hypothetical protein